MGTRVNVSAVRFAIILMAILSLLVMVMLTRIDHIVQGVLYDFGLNFSYRWAMPYWISSALIVGVSWFNIVASIILIYYVLRGKPVFGNLKTRPGVGLEANQQLTLNNYADRHDVRVRDEPLIQEQIGGLSVQIERYEVTQPRDVVDSQC